MKERKFINESIKRLLISEYIRKETDNAGFGGIEMKRNLLDTSIQLVVNKPGLVIGRRGSKVQEIEDTLKNKYKLEGPRIEVKEVKNPDLNAQIIAKKIAMSLEKGWAYRKAGNTALRRIIESNARGVMIKISGKISGERARTQKFFYGSIKYAGEPARAGIEYGYSTAKLKLGIIGISVRLLNREYKLPDDIVIHRENLVKGVKPEDVRIESQPIEKNE